LLHLIFLDILPSISAIVTEQCKSSIVALQVYIVFMLFVTAERECRYGEDTKQKRKKICCRL